MASASLHSALTLYLSSVAAGAPASSLLQGLTHSLTSPTGVSPSPWTVCLPL